MSIAVTLFLLTPLVFEAMRKEQASSEMKLEQLELGSRAPPRKKRCIERGNWISALFERLKDGQYSLSNYLDAIKYQTGLQFRCMCL